MNFEALSCAPTVGFRDVPCKKFEVVLAWDPTMLVHSSRSFEGGVNKNHVLIKDATNSAHALNQMRLANL